MSGLVDDMESEDWFLGILDDDGRTTEGETLRRCPGDCKKNPPTNEKMKEVAIGKKNCAWTSILPAITVIIPQWHNFSTKPPTHKTANVMEGARELMYTDVLNVSRVVYETKQVSHTSTNRESGVLWAKRNANSASVMSGRKSLMIFGTPSTVSSKSTERLGGGERERVAYVPEKEMSIPY